jgi:hypothetical protein
MRANFTFTDYPLFSTMSAQKTKLNKRELSLRTGIRIAISLTK